MQTTTTTTMRKLAWCTLALALILVLVLPQFYQQVEAKKKEKKLLKQLIKGLIFKNLSTKKNFLPLPVPIPVPIELDEPPVYLKGKPRYVTIYKPAMPVYSPPAYHYPMMHPYEDVHYDYSPMMSHYGNSYGHDKKTSASGSMSSFTDFDDDTGNDYVRNKSNKKGYGNNNKGNGNGNESGSSSSSSSSHKTGKGDGGGGGEQQGDNKRAFKRSLAIMRMAKRNSDGVLDEWLMPLDEQESIDHHDVIGHSRAKRQAPHYNNNYRRPPNYGEQEPPCYGFPLEVNIKSRIKMDQIFPIHGNSQMKKCVKFGPILPPPEEHPEYTVLTVIKPHQQPY